MKIGVALSLVAVLILTPFAACAEEIHINSVQTIIDDMTLAHERAPHGVPKSVNWAYAPRIGIGVDPASGKFTAFTAWGQIYESEQGNHALNTRVQIRGMKAYYLSKTTGEWITLQSSDDISGAAFVEDFANNENSRADIRNESLRGGGISVVAGGGFNFHFWPSGSRANIDTDDISALFTTFQVRLVLADEGKFDDRFLADYIASAGGDYWKDASTGWLADWSANGDFAIGRFKRVTNDWQAINAYAGSFDTLRQNPPPMD